VSVIAVGSTHLHAERLIESLVDDGPGTASQICERLSWPRGRFDIAVKYAREQLCPALGISIPSPTPLTGWTYQATTEWRPVEEGASFAMGSIESRLRGIYRDVTAVKPHLTKGSVEWRRASFLEKHVSHIINTLGEINGTR
jgi:hypothetical protein